MSASAERAPYAHKIIIAFLLIFNITTLYFYISNGRVLSAPPPAAETQFKGLEMLTDEEVEEVKKELRIDLNTADHRELQRLHRVGWTTADAIIKYRDAHGPFEFVEDIQRAKGVGPSTYQNNKDKIHALYEGTRKEFEEARVNINEASKDELVSRLSIGPSAADIIIQYRTRAGGIEKIDELKNAAGLGPDIYEKIADYVRIK